MEAYVLQYLPQFFPIITIPICGTQEVADFFIIPTIWKNTESNEVIFLIPNWGKCKNTSIWNTPCPLKWDTWYSVEIFKCKLWTVPLMKKKRFVEISYLRFFSFFFSFSGNFSWSYKLHFLYVWWWFRPWNQELYRFLKTDNRLNEEQNCENIKL